MAKRTLEVLLALGFILLAVAALCAWASPTTGYESSIYASTPIVVWACFFLSIACSIIAIMSSLYLCTERNTLWVHGLVLIVLCYVFILSLYIIRGYTVIGASGDTGTHLGYIINIVSTHRFEYHTLPYPMMHIFLSQLSLVLNVNPLVLISLITPYMAVFYVPFIYLLARSLFHTTRTTVIITLVAACTFFGYVNTSPNNLADLALPMSLFILFKSFGKQAWGWRILLLLLVLFLPMFHQITSIAFASTLAVSLVIYVFVFKHKNLAWQTLAINILALVLLIAWIALWQKSYILDSYIPSLIPVDFTSMPSTTPLLPSASTRISHLDRLIFEIRFASYYGYSAAEQFFKQYGILLACLVLTLLALPLLLRKRIKDWKAISLYATLVIIGLMMIALFFTAFKGGPYRFSMYLLMFGSIFAGFTLYTIIRWAKNKQKLIYVSTLGLVAILLLAIATNSMLIKYPSPYILQPNLQNTEAEIDGAKWFINNRDSKVAIYGWNYPIRRYVDYILGYNAGAALADALYENVKAYTLPRHFGYNRRNTLGESLGGNSTTYVVLTKLVQRHYIDVLPKMAVDFLLPSDFDKLDTDSSANHVYTSGELNVWYIYPKEM